MKIAFALVVLTVLAVGGESTTPTPPPGPTTPQPPGPSTPPAPTVNPQRQPPQLPVNPLRPPNQEFVSALDRIRMQPRAGEVSNGMFSSPLADVFTDSAETKMKVSSVMAEYERALVEQAKKWEKELSDLRAQYDAKIVAELPEARRDAVNKFLSMSREKWSESNARDAATRTEFLERMRKAATAAGPIRGTGPGTPSNAGSEWLAEERTKNANLEDQAVQKMRELLAPDEAARFDRRVRVRPAPRPPMPGIGQRPAGPVIPPTPPAQGATTPPAPVQPAVPPPQPPGNKPE